MSEFMKHVFGDLTVRIDRQTCIGSANCIRLATEVFRLDSQQIVSFTADPPEIDRQRLLESCRVCPVGALTVVDSERCQLVP
jgi:ferredoxin